MTRDDLERALVGDAANLRFSDGLLAETFQVDASMVGRARRDLQARGVIPIVAVRFCLDGHERNVAHIGRKVWLHAGDATAIPESVSTL